jgi:hypothetical protein
MNGRYLTNLLCSLLALGFISGCNFRTSQEESPTHNPATAAAQTLEVVFTKVAAQTEQPVPGTRTPGFSSTEARTSSPAIDETCTNRASFVDDVTIRDNTQIEHGSNFVKVWRLRNDGTCIWNRAYTVTFFGGERMGAPKKISLPDIIQPGQTIDLSIDLTAPEDPGMYQGFWRLQSGDGELFGIGSEGNRSFWVKISVIPSLTASATSNLTPTLFATGTVPPSKTPTSTETPTPSATTSPSPTLQPTPIVHSQGTVRLLLDRNVNLDNGEISPGAGGDIVLVEPDTSEYFLKPQNNALLALYVGSQIHPSIQDCDLTPKSTASLPITALAVNDNLCYSTDEGRPGYMTITALNSDVEFTFTTWVP